MKTALETNTGSSNHDTALKYVVHELEPNGFSTLSEKRTFAIGRLIKQIALVQCTSGVKFLDVR